MESTHCFVDVEYDVVLKCKVRVVGSLPVEAEMHIDKRKIDKIFENNHIKTNLEEKIGARIVSWEKQPTKHSLFFCATHILYGNTHNVYVENVGDSEEPEFLVDPRASYELSDIFKSTAHKIIPKNINGSLYFERTDGILFPIREIEPTEPK